MRRALACLVAFAPLAIAHEGHEHPRHARTVEAERFETSRPVNLFLPLPGEEDAFVFAIVGDRTGGPAEGIEVLRDAVRDINLVDPDLVMTVGDLVQGYNQTPEWLQQMAEYKSVMNGLAMPWFPVAGNHDVYWRGPDKPVGEHEADYETHFGPLWYAFSHKDCWFIALYSDEGDPETGVKDFHEPSAQRMSPAQFEWLTGTLEKAHDAQHVFVFLHHPRWLGENYGDDWERVHALLASAGNVTAVFAGHIHRMRYDGVRDGIEYFTLATTGGVQIGDVAEAGFLHHYHLVTVRPDHIAVTAVPVGAVMDPREVTGEVSEDVRTLADRLRPGHPDRVLLQRPDERDLLVVEFANPVRQPIEVLVSPGGAGNWAFTPDHLHQRIDVGEVGRFEFQGWRTRFGIESIEDLPRVTWSVDYLAPHARISVPERAEWLPLDLRDLRAPAVPEGETALRLDGVRDYIAVEGFDLADGPFTVEGWLRAEAFTDREGFVSKTEGSEFGLFVDGGRPRFSVHLDGKYVNAEASEAVLEPGLWHHVAGVFDGEEVRLYVDGALRARVAGHGSRTPNGLPLVIGGDVDRSGAGTSLFAGDVDGVRISRGVRYVGESVEPERRAEPRDEDVLLLHMDGRLGPWMFDSSPLRAHALIFGEPVVVAVD